MDTNALISVSAFVVLTLLWIAFGVALLFRPALLCEGWRTYRSWPLLIQLGVALLTLPVVLGLWIWNAAWPAWLRLVLVAGLAWMTVYTFFPRTLFA